MTNQQLLQQLQQLLEAAQNLGAPAAQIVQQIRLLINRVQVLNANDPANQNDVNEFNRLQGEFQRLQQPAPQPQQPPPGQQPSGLYLPPIPVNVQGGINVQVGTGAPPPQQPAQPQRFPWWATVTIVAASLLTFFGLVWVITSKIPNKRIAKAILTSERAEITMIGNFSGVNSDKDLSDELLTKIDASAKKEQEHQIAKEAVEKIGQSVEELRKEIGEIKTQPPKVIVKIVEKPVPAPAPSAAPAPPPSPKPTPTDNEEYTFTWLNSRTEDCEVWIDGILPKRILKPGESLHIRANTPLTAWARGTKSKRIWKYKVTKEKVEKAKEKVLEIY